MGTEKGRRVFTQKARHMEPIVFFFSNGALFCWMIACIAMGYTKYQDPKPQQWEPSFYITLFCTILLFSIYPFMLRKTPLVLPPEACGGGVAWRSMCSCWFWVYMAC